MTNKYETMQGILKLYELRREETMRLARDWFLRFDPASADEIVAAYRGEHSAYFRMVTSYWDMAAALVNGGSIDEQMFNDTTSEHFVVFSKIAPFIAEVREKSGVPQYLSHLERLVTRQPDAGERMARLRELARNIKGAQTAPREGTKTQRA